MIPRLRETVGVGFEPTVAYATTVFKTAAFVHSAIPPSFFIALTLIIPQKTSFVKENCNFLQKSADPWQNVKSSAFLPYTLYSIPLKMRNVKFIFKKIIL